MQLAQEGALTARPKKKPTCYFYNKVGHIKKDCEEYAKVKGQSDRKVKVQTKPAEIKKKTTIGALKVTITAYDENSSDSEGCGLVVVDPRTHDCPVLPNPRNMTKVVRCLMSFGVS